MSRPEPDDASTQLRPRREEELVVGALALRVVSGPDAGKQFAMDASRPSRVLLGKGPACEMQVVDPLVSRRHLAFDPSPAGLRLTDLGSANGSYVNGVRITECFVEGGETIRVGDTTIEVHVVGPSSAAALPDVMRFGKMLGKSPAMRALYPLCEKLAASDIPVVIEGETGTGKEVLAEAIHEASPRANGPFVVFDCTAVPPNLVESVLFGHERGAFTGATNARRGVFEEASGGTLLIDEIGDLDASLQPKLLRALERGEVQRVGSNQWIRIDVRVLSATRRNLDHEVQAGRFRDDLFFRLAVGRIELPSLRDRHGDIALLARHFWRALGDGESSIPAPLLARLEDYQWPGNVRELHNAVLRALALGTSASMDAPGLTGTGERRALSQPPPPPELSADDSIAKVLDKDLPLARARDELVAEFERRYVERILAKHGGNVVRAAAASGIARRYFQILRARYGR